LVEAVKRLPDETQEALVEEFRDRLADFTDANLSEAQRNEVDRRLANPRSAATEEVLGARPDSGGLGGSWNDTAVRRALRA
jgi:putative addiction module component (TIGR02574 family)